MATHHFNTGAGVGAQTGATGGVGGGGGGSAPAGTVTIEEIRDTDDNGGSNQIGVSYAQVGFANAPLTCSASTDATLKFYLSSTNRLTLLVSDDSSSSGEIGTSDLSASTRPAAVQPPTLNDFSGKDGDFGTEQYSRNLSTYTYGVREINYVDGEGFNDTARDDIYWNGAKVYEAGFNMGSTWSPGDEVAGDSDGYTYRVGSYQEVYNDNTYYAVLRGFPSEEHYRFGTVNAVTGLKMDFIADTLTNASGATVPLRILSGNPIASGTNSSGWITSNMSTGITLQITQITGTLSDDTKTHVTDGTVKLYGRTATEEGLIKEFRLRVYTHATSTY